MRSFKQLSIKSKMTAIIMLTCFIALMLACAAFITQHWVTSRKILVLETSTLAEVTAGNVQAAVTFDNPQDAEKMMANLRGQSQIVAACIYKEGKIWARYPHGLPTGDLPKSPLSPATAFNPKPWNYSKPSMTRTITRSAHSSSALTSNRCAPGSVVELVIDLGVLLVASIVALALSTRLQGLISQPILGLARTARLVSDKKDYSVRATKSSEDELGRVIDSFNEMLAQIEAADTELQRNSEQAEASARRTQEASRPWSRESRSALPTVARHRGSGAGARCRRAWPTAPRAISSRHQPCEAADAPDLHQRLQ